MNIFDYHDKCSLTVEENVFYAKKLIVESVYTGMRAEGYKINYPEIETILCGVEVPGISEEDTEYIFKLKNAWLLMLSSIDEPVTIDYIYKVYCAVRQKEREINQTHNEKCIRDELEREAIRNQLQNILKLPSVTLRAINYFIWSIGSHIFKEANIQTNLIIANKMLISGGRGLLIIREDYLSEFNYKLQVLLASEDIRQIGDFLYDKCILFY